MPPGIIRQTEPLIIVRLLENIAAANTVADGASADVLKPIPSTAQFFPVANVSAVLRRLGYEWPIETSISLYETAGSGTMTIASARLFFYDIGSQKRYPGGTGADATKGMLNNGASFGETGSDQLRHAEPIFYAHHWDGIQVELGTFGGTSPTFNVEWRIPLLKKLAAA